MFDEPIRHTPLKDLDDVQRMSIRIEGRTEAPNTWCQNNGQVAFTSRTGHVYVTPYREELRNIFQEYHFEESGYSVPFSNSEERPPRYKWLVHMAEQENWSATYEKAREVAKARNLKDVRLHDIQIERIHMVEKEWETITTYDTMRYRPMVEKFVMSGAENIGTYIIIDNWRLLVCDEYGRTFYIQTKPPIDRLVNRLLEAGYYWTIHPEYFVKHIDGAPLFPG